MPIPPSPHFTALSLAAAFNADRAALDGGLRPRRDPPGDWSATSAFGAQSYCGIPFALGEPDRPNVILVPASSSQPTPEIRIDFPPRQATYLVFLHAVEDRARATLPSFGAINWPPQVSNDEGNELGEWVADYVLVYDDGAEAVTPIVRRFAIQQRHITWGASPFASSPALASEVFPLATEDVLLERAAHLPTGRAETRHRAGRDRPLGEHLWLYALPNPIPEKPVAAIKVLPGEERAVIYGISVTQLSEHPLRPGTRQKLLLHLPAGAELNALGELDPTGPDPAIGIDLGTVISARATLDYDADRWLSDAPEVQPTPSTERVVVEYAAHPRATLHIATGPATSIEIDLPDVAAGNVAAQSTLRVEPIAPADRSVRLRLIDADSRQPVAARLHLHGEAGEYLPPHGHHRKVNPYWFEDNYAEFVNGGNQYAYVSGECVANLPLGKVYVEISRGYEVSPLRTAVQVTPATDELTFELHRRLDWRGRGWVTADTHVHFLSPQTALLEGAAEGVNVVNLLASQWGEMFSNVGDFDGRTVLGARDFGGDGEFLVRVGTENRMQVLGHISLLGYTGPMIVPLCTGGPSESAIGDPQVVSMAEWAARCRTQQGLVVMPHAPNPQAERTANIALGLVDAIELMTFNPHDAQISPFGLADWYRHLNVGHQAPLVGGSDKMSAASLLGGVRTYAHLGDRPFTYDDWMGAVRAGNTFVTVGPLIEFAVEGLPAGSQLRLPAGGGTVEVTWTVESVGVPIEQIELIVGGMLAEQVTVGGARSTSGRAAVPISDSTWLALRVRGSYRDRPGDIAAHTSAVQVIVGDAPLFSPTDALAMLAQIEGTLAYVDTLAPRPAATRLRQLRATLEMAHARLHQRLHAAGVAHLHAPLHEPGQVGEH
jgi:hypothetical protein